MRNLCTLSDKNYVAQGKALIRSLRQTCSYPFTMYYLFLDEETFNALEGYDVERVRLETVEASRGEITHYKQMHPYNEYCWSLASTFCRYIFEKLGVADILYIDSDIYFYQDLKIIEEEQNNNSIGIIRHRHNTSSSPDGEFNVGIIYFKNDEAGLACLRWWNDAILSGSHPQLATCGDQKYLEYFITGYQDKVTVLDKTFAHGAPWNFRLYVYDNFHTNGTVIWGNIEQPLVFNHFSRMKLEEGKISPTSGQYADHTLGFQVFNIPVVNQFYHKYAQELSK